jgi:hypothetical protein
MLRGLTAAIAMTVIAAASNRPQPAVARLKRRRPRHCDMASGGYLFREARTPRSGASAGELPRRDLVSKDRIISAPRR